ncbi:MAG: hypothetical protein IKC23_08705 [Fibrobacter sp.]|nr:hypothetical protein [Fibrobacter sp.]
MNLLHRLLKNNLAQYVNNGHLEDIRIHIFKIEGVVSEMCRYIGIFYAIKADSALVYIKRAIIGRKGRNTGYIERLNLYPAKRLAHGVFDCSGNAPGKCLCAKQRGKYKKTEGCANGAFSTKHRHRGSF